MELRTYLSCSPSPPSNGGSLSFNLTNQRHLAAPQNDEVFKISLVKGFNAIVTLSRMRTWVNNVTKAQHYKMIAKLQKILQRLKFNGASMHH